MPLKDFLLPKLGLIASMFACGCGGSAKVPNEKLVPASGAIKLDGKPVAGVRIRLTPFNDTTKTVGGAWALTDDQGAFDVMHWTNKKGIVPGSYQITFSKMLKPDGTPLGDKDSPAMVNAKEVIAPQWSTPVVDQRLAVTRRVDIPESGKDNIEFAITSSVKK